MLYKMITTIDKSWTSLFNDFICKPPSLPLTETYYPPTGQVFSAFTMPVTNIRVVLIGQDPYHGPGQAHGLSFSVPEGVPVPPSLRNIFKELISEFPDRGYDFKHGNLQAWHDREGIFLLNAALTVAPGRPNSHASLWNPWTDKVIEYILEHNKTCIFLLLGAFAQTKANIIDDPKRWVFGVHPSPLSAHRGFFGSGIFKRLEDRLGGSINWQN
jgi:uracil-DNA glycosylase